jgi:hypothetical protein
MVAKNGDLEASLYREDVEVLLERRQIRLCAGSISRAAQHELHALARRDGAAIQARIELACLCCGTHPEQCSDRGQPGSGLHRRPPVAR